MDNNVYQDVFVARQPIFDALEKVFAYELLFRHSGQAGFARIDDAEQATSKVIADGVDLVQDSLEGEQRLFINFPAKLIVQGAPEALAQELCVVEILETVKPHPKVLAALEKLKEQGYTLDSMAGLHHPYSFNSFRVREQRAYLCRGARERSWRRCRSSRDRGCGP